MKDKDVAYRTEHGLCINGRIEDVIQRKSFQKYKGKVSLILTSPPFPLNRKKKYGNLNGEEYISWLTGIFKYLIDFLSEDGSVILEIGNAWNPKEPTMSTLPLETLLAIKNENSLFLCQQFVWYNTAKLPGPIQWVNIEKCRVKDSFTNIWWLSKSPRPKACNSNVLEEYSESMKKLLKNKKYNSGKRPSEHNINPLSFLKNNGGSIPSNVLVTANTNSSSQYIKQCKSSGIVPHPARMPTEIPEFFVNFLTEKDDLVLDPFSGSNTTGYVCEKLHRNWISVELNEQYIQGSKFRFSHEKTDI